MGQDAALRLSDADFAYYNGDAVKVTTTSSTLVSSSPYLNMPGLRALISQEYLRRNGPDMTFTAFIPDVVQLLNQAEDWGRIAQLFEEEKARLPEFRAWLEGRKPSLFTVAELEGAEPGTLREVIHEFVTQSGYNMDHFYQGMEIKSDLDFYLKERTHTHDIEHMITGFETNYAGEHALLAANTRSFFNYFTPEFAGFVCRVNVYLKTKAEMQAGLHYPEGLKIQYEAEDVGAALGRQLKRPLFTIPYRDYLDWQVTDLREELGITAFEAPESWAGSNALIADAAVDTHVPEMAVAAE